MNQQALISLWKGFWTVALVVAGSGFAIVTLVVILKGGGDLRAMLRGLKRHRNDDRTH
ncbi:MAG TPA: hypothetical protein VMT47_04770 [Polyangia bacterium]|nr:hypothetical protein [Polyangia bacterium]